MNLSLGPLCWEEKKPAFLHSRVCAQMWVECQPQNSCFLFTHLLCFSLQGLNVNSEAKEPWACGRRKDPSTCLHVSYCGHACTHTEHTVALSLKTTRVRSRNGLCSCPVFVSVSRIQTELLNLTPQVCGYWMSPSSPPTAISCFPSLVGTDSLHGSRPSS